MIPGKLVSMEGLKEGGKRERIKVEGMDQGSVKAEGGERKYARDQKIPGKQEKDRKGRKRKE